MKLSIDSKQRITTTLLMFLEFYKILMATFLVLFVPQQCGLEVCTITENFLKRDPVNFAALISNFITFVSVLNFYIVEIKEGLLIMRFKITETTESGFKQSQ